MIHTYNVYIYIYMSIVCLNVIYIYVYCMFECHIYIYIYVDCMSYIYIHIHFCMCKAMYVLLEIKVGSRPSTEPSANQSAGLGVDFAAPLGLDVALKERPDARAGPLRSGRKRSPNGRNQKGVPQKLL